MRFILSCLTISTALIGGVALAQTPVYEVDAQIDTNGTHRSTSVIVNDGQSAATTFGDGSGRITESLGFKVETRPSPYGDVALTYRYISLEENRATKVETTISVFIDKTMTIKIDDQTQIRVIVERK